MLQRIGLIGFGAIGQSIAAHLREACTEDIRLTAICVRPGRVDSVRRIAPDEVVVTDSIAGLIESRPDAIIEAAGQGAIEAHAEQILLAGLDLFVLSLGALADPVLRGKLLAAAVTGGGGICLPAGALAGFDGLLSMRKAGLKAVTYVSTKPPLAWKGTPAEAAHSLENLDRRTVIFRGNAAEAALLYPKNANLAAAVALAGIGFEATRVELVADPQASGNTGAVLAQSATATLELSLSSHSLEENPKTSAITGLSVLAAIENQNSRLRFV